MNNAIFCSRHGGETVITCGVVHTVRSSAPVCTRSSHRGQPGIPSRSRSSSHPGLFTTYYRIGYWKMRITDYRARPGVVPVAEPTCLPWWGWFLNSINLWSFTGLWPNASAVVIIRHLAGAGPSPGWSPSHAALPWQDIPASIISSKNAD